MSNAQKPTIAVVHIITSMISGGAETSLLRLLSRYDREKFPSSVIALNGEGTIARQIEDLGVEVIDLGMRPGRVPSPMTFVALVRHLRRLRPDIVQSWMYHADLMATLALPFVRRAALLWNVRCSDVTVGTGRTRPLPIVRLLAWLSRRPAAVVVNSRAGLDYHASCRYVPRRWEIILNGFDLNVFHADPAGRIAVRAELAVPPDAPLIGLVARWDPIKNHRMFLRAAELLLVQRPDARFVLVGSGMTPSNATLASWVENSSLAGHVDLLGERTDIPKLMAGFDILSLTSSAEGFPNVIGEAMACEVPCVATDVGDVRWMIGDAGRVVPPGDPTPLASAWAELLSQSPEERAVLGRYARKRVEQNFTIAAATNAYEKLYAGVSGTIKR